MADRQGPLSHIRVLDMGRIMAAPWATQILADMGADVIKVEKPGVGDDTRSWGPPFLKAADGSPTKEAGYYLSVNRGKRSVTIDMATAQGQAIIRKLAEQSDVVVENFKVGALARYGLDAASLRATQAKPDLLLDYWFRPGWSSQGSGGLRFCHPGDGRPDEHHRRT